MLGTPGLTARAAAASEEAHRAASESGLSTASHHASAAAGVTLLELRAASPEADGRGRGGRMAARGRRSSASPRASRRGT